MWYLISFTNHNYPVVYILYITTWCLIFTFPAFNVFFYSEFSDLLEFRMSIVYYLLLFTFIPLYYFILPLYYFFILILICFPFTCLIFLLILIIFFTSSDFCLSSVLRIANNFRSSSDFRFVYDVMCNIYITQAFM